MSCNQLMSEQINVYAATALMLASKTIELDMKIPFISKLKKYTMLDNPASDFKQAELKLLKHFNWKLQYCTLIDHMESFLAMGIIFATDSICQDNLGDLSSPYSIKLESHYGQAKKPKSYIPLSQLSDSKIKEICHRIEKDYLRVANLVVRELQFLMWSEGDKSLASILYLRKLCGLYPVCPQQLFELVTDDILKLLEDIVQSLDPIFTQNMSVYSPSAAVSPAHKTYTSENKISEQEFKTESKQSTRVPLGPHNNQEVKQFRSNIKPMVQNDEDRKQLSDCKINLIQVVGPSVQPRLKNIRTPTSVHETNQYLLRFGSGQVKLNPNNHIK